MNQLGVEGWLASGDGIVERNKPRMVDLELLFPIYTLCLSWTKKARDKESATVGKSCSTVVVETLNVDTLKCSHLVYSKISSWSHSIYTETV